MFRKLYRHFEEGRRRKEPAARRSGAVLLVAAVAIACVAIGAIVVMSHRLSDLDRVFAGSQEMGSYQNVLLLENGQRRRRLYGQEQLMAARTGKLESIVTGQNRMLFELIDLNKISIHPFAQLNQRIDQTNHLILATQTDPGHYLGRVR